MRWLRAHWLPFTLILLISILSRLPLLLSEHFIMDGDECIMGIMSKHFIEGRHVPIFFYGQNYGFAFIEVLFISIGYLLFGISDYVVKLSVFALWIFGLFFFYRALCSISGNKWSALLFVMVLILAPAWAQWSLKARGGYLTAFTCSSLALYLLVYKGAIRDITKWALIGLLTGIVFASQPLWLPGLLQFLFWGIRHEIKIKNILSFLLAIGVFLGAMFILRIGQSTYWQPNVVSDIANPFWVVRRFVYYNFTGYYYLQDVHDEPLGITLFVYLFSALAIVGLLLAVVMVGKKKGSLGLLVASIVSSALSFLYIFKIDITSPRYGLPLTGWLIVLTYLVYTSFEKKLPRQISNVLVVVLLIIGGYSITLFKDFALEVNRKDVSDAIAVMEQHGIEKVYTQSQLLYWQVSFYSKENITGRSLFVIDRYLPYVAATESVYAADSSKTAILSIGYPFSEENVGTLISTQQKIFVHQSPSIAFLTSIGFE